VKKPKTLLARVGAAVVGAALASGALVAVSAPAYAADLGTVILSQQSGSVTDTPMFASGTTSAPCPATFGEEASLRIGPANVNGPFANLAPAVGGGGYDQAPVTINPNRSFQTALGQAPAAGDWWIVFECFSLTEGRHPDRFVTPITVTGTTWRVQTPVRATSTTLDFAPSSPQPEGTVVTLTASVTPSDAAGTVEFLDGSTSLGSAPVTAGSASQTVSDLAVGTHQLKAVFTPDDETAFAGSESVVRPYVISGAGGIGVPQQLHATVEAGEFSLTVNGTDVTLTAASVGGTSTGSLNTATVVDLRGSNAGWDLTGISSDFTGPGTITATNLGWEPTATKVSGSGTVTPGATVTPATGGLATPRSLASAASGSSAGSYQAAGGLTLSVPDTANSGNYNATLTLTLA
jgi:hypothetical protein